MPDRKYPRSGRRAILSYADLAANADEYVLVCASKAVLEIARAFVRERGLWRTTYATAYFNDGYDIPSPTEMDLIEELISEFLEDTNDMNCQDFVDELNAIAAAINRSAAANELCCGGGSAGAGNTEEDPEAFVDDQDSTFPTGYSDRQEYLDTKCNQAEHIRLELVDDMEWINSTFSTSTTITILIAALVTPVPFDDALALLYFASSLLLQALLTATSQEVIDYLNDNAAQIRCDLVNATDVANAIDVIDDGTMSSLASELLSFFLTNDVFNRLFEFEENVGDYAVNCTSCTCEWVVDFGSGTPTTDGVDFIISSEETSPGVHNCGIQLTPNCCDLYDLEIVANTAGSFNGAILEQSDPCPALNDISGSRLQLGTYTDIAGQIKQTSTGGPFTLTLNLVEA